MPIREDTCPSCTNLEEEPAEARMVRGMREVLWYECSVCGAEWRLALDKTVTEQPEELV